MHIVLYVLELAAFILAILALCLFVTRRLSATKLAPGAVVLVTGGSRGLGLAIASRFAKKQKTRLVLASRHLDELQKAQSTLLARYAHLAPEDFLLVAADLAKPAECQRLVSETITRFGRIDVLVNNAGIIEVGPAEIQPVSAFEQAMQINFFAAFYTTWAALPHLQEQAALPGTTGSNRRAAIVNIASIGGKIAVPHMLPYTAAKFALVGFSEGLHAELHKAGILVTTVCPGLMRSGGEDHAKFIGDVEAEKRWFMFAAKTPGVATTITHAANKIFRAVSLNHAEITITPQAYLAARVGGLFPESVQFANAITNRFILPGPTKP